MKILVVGDWHSDLHEQAVFDALQRLGHEVFAFAWHRYFLPRSGALSGLDSFLKRAQNKYLLGPVLRRLNRDLLAAAQRHRPEMVFVYRGTHVLPSTLRKLRRLLPRTRLVGYNNDDPFAPGQFFRLFVHFLRGIPHYDLVLAYRHRNLQELEQAGARRTGLLRSWFIPQRNRRVELSAEDLGRYGSDITFVGHFEDDGRVDCLNEIARRGWKLRIFGPSLGWDEAIQKYPALQHLAPIQPVRGEEYNKALCGARIALCFFSKLNRDTYTRRCFEIPAAGTMMLSEYSDDLAGLYTEGQDAEFFRTPDELTRKVEHYLTHEAQRAAVALGGWNRVHDDGHDVDSRMHDLIERIALLRETEPAC